MMTPSDETFIRYHKQKGQSKRKTSNLASKVATRMETMHPSLDPAPPKKCLKYVQ